MREIQEDTDEPENIAYEDQLVLREFHIVET